MTRPLPPTKVLLVADRRDASSEPNAARVRRYRLARVRFDGRMTDENSRFEHLRRVYD